MVNEGGQKMKRLFAGGTCLAAVMAFGMVALAQEPTPSQPPSQPPTTQPPTTQQPTTPPPTQPEPSTRPSTRPQSEMRSAEQQVTIVGCVQSETDYRRAKNLGGAGAMGTGAGAGNEFVLVNASMSHGSSAAGTTAGAPSATGTAGSTASASGEAYELTGSGESKAASFVGKRVEITGKLKASETGPTGTTGGATAGTPPSGVDVASKDLRLKEIEVTSVRETTGTCPSTGSDK
jgi:hypothetical protein